MSQRVWLLLFGTIQVLAAQSPTRLPPWTRTVSVEVSAEPAKLQDEIISYVGRELRSLGDIRVVDGAADYRVCVNAMELANGAGHVDGVVMAVVVQMPFPWDTITLMMPGLRLKEEDRKFFEAFEGMLDFWLVTGNRDHVPDLCRRMVTHIDIKVFEPLRKDYRALTGVQR